MINLYVRARMGSESANLRNAIAIHVHMRVYTYVRVYVYIHMVVRTYRALALDIDRLAYGEL